MKSFVIPSSLQFSRRDETVLSTEALARIAPSIFASSPMQGVSDRYRFVSTAEVVENFRANNWFPVAASEQRVRLDERNGFQMHHVRFTQFKPVAEMGDVRADIILTNSHDRSSAYNLIASSYRLVCRNGLLRGETEGNDAVSVRHSGVTSEAFTHATAAIIGRFQSIGTDIARLKSKFLTPAAKVEFATQAARFRWDDPMLSPTLLLKPKRRDDVGDDLWRTFNVVQEHLMRGGDTYYAEGLRRNSTRAVSGITQAIRLNRSLWTLAQVFANN